MLIYFMRSNLSQQNQTIFLLFAVNTSLSNFFLLRIIIYYNCVLPFIIKYLLISKECRPGDAISPLLIFTCIFFTYNPPHITHRNIIQQDRKMGNCCDDVQPQNHYTNQKNQETNYTHNQVSRTQNGVVYSVKGNRYQPHIVKSVPEGEVQSPKKKLSMTKQRSDSPIKRDQPSPQFAPRTTVYYVNPPKQTIQPQPVPLQQPPTLMRQSGRQQSIFSSKMGETSISSASNLNNRESMRHMSGYRHVHVVRQPSLMDSTKMSDLNDSKRIGGFFSPALNLRRTNTIEKDYLSGIREEPSSVTYA